MKLQQLRYFVAVYEEGSITAGAERAHATQSGLSMQIKDLEERYDAVLFERAANGVHPTEMGRRFYEYATRILKEVAEAEQGMKALRGIITGRVRVGLMPTFTRAIFPPAVMDFSEQYPLVDISVVEAYSAQLTKDVLQGVLDFAIVPAGTDALQAGLRGQSIGKDKEFLVSRKEKKSQHMQPARLDKQSKVKLVLPSSKNARRQRIDAYLKRKGVVPIATMELDAMLGTLELVRNSGWQTILPGALCIPDVATDGLCLNPLIDAPEIEYMLIAAKSGPLSAGAQLFADMLQQEFDRQVDWQSL